MSADRRILGAISVLAVLAGWAPPAAFAAPGSEAQARQLLTHYNCGQAKAAESDLKRAAALAPDERMELEIVSAKCSAEQHNRDRPGEPQVVLVTPDPQAGGQDKIYLQTVILSDERGIREFCTKAGGPGATVGGTSCEAFVRQTRPSAPLILLAPASVSGPVVTTHLLSMIGDEDAARRIAAEADRVQAAAGGKAALTGSQSSQGSASASDAGQRGTRARFFQAAKCVASMGFREGCDKGDQK